MTHLTPDELIDAVEETLAPARRNHLHECPQCGDEVLQLAVVLRQTRGVTVPEPSPLFWDQFSDRIRAAIATEPAARRFPQWFQWPVLAPLAGLALLVFALMSAVPRAPDNLQPIQMAVNDSGAAEDVASRADADERWDVLSELVGDIDLETAQQAGIAVGPGSAEGVVLQLTSAERHELVRLLRAELQRAGG